MITSRVIDAAQHLADTLDDTGHGPWQHFTCTEIDMVVNLMMAVDRPDVAASLIVHHAESDTTPDGGDHTAIGDAVRAEADLRDVTFTDRASYKLAAAYVADLF